MILDKSTKQWKRIAKDRHDKEGLQSINTTLMNMVSSMGELSKAVKEYDDVVGPIEEEDLYEFKVARMQNTLADLASHMYIMQVSLDPKNREEILSSQNKGENSWMKNHQQK